MGVWKAFVELFIKEGREARSRHGVTPESENRRFADLLDNVRPGDNASRGHSVHVGVLVVTVSGLDDDPLGDPRVELTTFCGEALGGPLHSAWSSPGDDDCYERYEQ